MSRPIDQNIIVFKIKILSLNNISVYKNIKNLSKIRNFRCITQLYQKDHLISLVLIEHEPPDVCYYLSLNTGYEIMIILIVLLKIC